MAVKYQNAFSTITSVLTTNPNHAVQEVNNEVKNAITHLSQEHKNTASGVLQLREAIGSILEKFKQESAEISQKIRTGLPQNVTVKVNGEEEINVSELIKKELAKQQQTFRPQG